MKKIIIFCLWLGGYSYGHAQTISILDEETDQPLEWVAILSKNPNVFAHTNAEGQADISAFKDAAQVEIRLNGYKAVVMSFHELQQQNFRLKLSPSPIALNQLVISANRWSQPTQDVPIRVSTISPKDVTLQNPQTAADLLGISGEVFIQKSQQGGGSPMIRGFATNRLLYAVDGVRMNTAIFRSGNIQNVISLDALAIEHTEVLFGPGSVIYGSDAIGGVMSFQTLTPQLSLNDQVYLKGKALARYSSANQEKTVHFDINLGWKQWSLLTSFSSNDFEHLRMGRNGPDEYLRPRHVQTIDGVDVQVNNEDPHIQNPSAYSQVNLMQKIRFRPHQNWDFQYGFHYSTTSNYARYDRHLRFRNDLPRSAEWNYGPQVWMMNHLQVNHQGNQLLYDQMSLRLAHQYFEESRIDRNFNDSERRTRLEKVNAYSLNLDFSQNVGDKLLFFYGLEGVWNDVNSSGKDEDIQEKTSQQGPARYPNSEWASWAAYLMMQYKISEKFLLQAGLRYNQFDLSADFTNNLDFYPFPESEASIHQGALIGSLGWVYQATDSWTIGLNLAKGFRSPNVDDIGKFFDSEPGSVIVPNPGLDAEKAYNLDLNLAKIFGERLKIDLSAYYTWLDDALVRRDFSLNGQDSILYDGTLSRVQALQNAAIARVYGIQAGLELKLPGGFGFATRFNYQKGEEELDDGSTSPLRHATPWYGVARLSYSHKGLDLQLYAMYSGRRKFEDLPLEEQGKPEIYAVDDQGNPYSPGWYTLNIKVLYQLNATFSVSTGIENLTDQRYRPYSSGIVAPGRNLIMALKAGF